MTLPKPCQKCIHRSGQICAPVHRGIHLLKECPKGLWPDKPLPPPSLVPSDLRINVGSGIGIVIAGGGIYLKSAWITVRMLRHFGCQLPVEIWLLPWEKVSVSEQHAFEFMGCTFHFANEDYVRQEPFYSSRWEKDIYPAGWQLKVQAVLQSSFCNVISLDADCYPICQAAIPALLAAGPGTFFGDIVESTNLSPEANVFAVYSLPHRSIDSGVFYVSKASLPLGDSPAPTDKLPPEAWLAPWCQQVATLNSSVNVTKVYNDFYGDKDTWSNAATNVQPSGKQLLNCTGILHFLNQHSAFFHRTGNKLTDGTPPNSPQKIVNASTLPCEDLVQKFAKGWPVLSFRNARDFELQTGVLEDDEYHLSSLLWSPDYAPNVVDAGAHIGAFTAAVQRRWPEANIMAFEPEPTNVVFFEANTGIAAVEAALSDKKGSVALVPCSPGDTCFTTNLALATGSTPIGPEVRTVLLSDFLQIWNRVDLLKLDIEGDEAKVAADLVGTGAIKKVRRIVGEWHTLQVLTELLHLIRHTHHVTVCVHHWEHGYFEAVRNDQL